MWAESNLPTKPLLNEPIGNLERGFSRGNGLNHKDLAIPIIFNDLSSVSPGANTRSLPNDRDQTTPGQGFVEFFRDVKNPCVSIFLNHVDLLFCLYYFYIKTKKIQI